MFYLCLFLFITSLFLCVIHIINDNIVYATFMFFIVLLNIFNVFMSYDDGVEKVEIQIVREIRIAESNQKILSLNNKHYDNFETFKKDINKIDDKTKYNIKNVEGEFLLENCSENILELYVKNFFNAEE